MIIREVHGAAAACLVAVLVAATATATAAGVVSGVVIDGLTGQPVRGATVLLEDAGVEMTSDLGGAFQGEAEAGTYTAVVSREGFEPQRVTDIVVADGEVADFAVVLLPSSGTGPAADTGATASADVDGTADAAGTQGGGAAFTGEITVTADAVTSTAAALLAERKGAAAISDAIGAEEMSRNTGSDAAGALKRVTGISLQNDKFVYVRGLGGRYSNTALNGSRLPSTEFEKKVVPLDLLPANMLNSMRVSKSYTVDRPGDFAAWLVELETLDFPTSETASLGFSMGHDSVATGERFGEYGDGLSWSGDGGQPLPTAFPTEPLIRQSPFNPEGFSPAELEALGESLAGDWTPSFRSSAPANLGYNGTYGNTFGRLGLVVSGTYSHGYDSRAEEQSFYRPAGGGGLATLHTYDLDSWSESVRRGLVGNLSYRLNDEHHVKLRTMVTENSVAETRYQEGYYDVPRALELQELADKLDVSHQSLSEQLRRGHETLIASTLYPQNETLKDL